MLIQHRDGKLMSNTRQRWIALVLVISLAVNIALAGYVVGISNKPPPTFDPTRGFALWTRTLPEERRGELRRFLREHRGKGRHHLPRLLRQNAEMQAALVAKPFDPARLDRVLTSLRERGGEVQTQSHRAFVQLVSQLTDEERALLAEDLQTKRSRRHRAGFGRNSTEPLDPRQNHQPEKSK